MATTASTDITAAPRPRARPGRCVTIDGQQVACDRGDTILDAAQRVGIHIPTLCYEPRLPATAACRMCIVEVEGARKMVPSCSSAVADGMVVHTDTQKVRAMRHLYLELLLSDHNSFCTPPCRDACPTHIKIPQFLDAHRAQGLQERRAQAARGPAVPGHPRARVPAALRGSVPAPARRAPHHHLPAAPLHGRPDHRRGADRRAAAAGRAQARHRQAASPSWAAGPPASPPPSTRGSKATASRSSRPCPSRAACCATASPRYRLPRDVIDKELNVLWRMGVELHCDTRLGVDFQLERAHGATTTPCSWPWAPSTATRWASPAKHAEGVVTAVDFLGELEVTGDVHVGRQGHRHRRRLHRHGRLPHQRAQGRRRGHLPVPALAQGDAGARHRGRRGRGRGRQARAAVRAAARRSTDERNRSPASRCSAWSSASPTPPGAAARCRSKAPSSSSSATRSSPPSASSPSWTAPARSRA